MSTIDENEIQKRLESLSKIQPNQDAAERAMRRVRDALATEECRVRLAPPRAVGWIKLTKLAVAAVLLIGAGILIGRLTGPEPTDVDALRKSLLAEMDSRWQSAFEANRTQVKDELQQQVRRDLMQFASQTLAASGTQTQQQLRELIQLIEAARMQDRLRTEQALEHIESQFGSRLLTLAERTNELQRIEQN